MSQPSIEGSSKQFYPLEDGQFLMQFKDAIHGANREDQILGTGMLRQRFTYAFYRYLEANGVRTHLSNDSDALRDDGIVVQRCEPIKMEVLVRNVARGHWVDQHKVPLFDGGVVFQEPIVEFCVKIKKQLEDGRIMDDPRVNAAVAVALNRDANDPAIRGHMIRSTAEALGMESLALQINTLLQNFLSRHGWTLEDFKFELGVALDGSNRDLILIDEISPDSSRIRDAEGNSLSKDLFRQRKPQEEIYAGYLKLTEAMETACQEVFAHG